MSTVKDIDAEVLCDIETLRSFDVNFIKYDLQKNTVSINYKLETPIKSRSYYSYRQKVSETVKGATMEEAMVKLNNALKATIEKRAEKRRKEALAAQKKAESLRQEAVRLDEEARKLLSITTSEGTPMSISEYFNEDHVTE
jgi:hypothetical protein